MANSRNKLVQIKFFKDTFRYRADFLDGETSVNWKWLTTVESDALNDLNLVGMRIGSGRMPVLVDADRIMKAVDNGDIFFDSPDETNFEWMLKELLAHGVDSE
jgi:hypothetical protein